MGQPRSVSFSDPYLTGFDYSRPVSSVSMSESPFVNLLDNLYRHPNVQGSSIRSVGSRGFRKRHHIYALGIIMTEIAYWKPLESTLRLPRPAELRPADAFRVREVLISQGHQESLQSRMGDSVANVIFACVEGNIFLGETEGMNGTSSHEKFCEDVVYPLTRLCL